MNTAAVKLVPCVNASSFFAKLNEAKGNKKSKTVVVFGRTINEKCADRQAKAKLYGASFAEFHGDPSRRRMQVY